MTQLKSFFRRPAGKHAARVGGVAIAALVAVVLTFFGTTPPHAQAQLPREPAEAGKFELQVVDVGFDNADAGSAADSESITWTITPSDPNCWLERSVVRMQINEHSVYRWQGTPDMARHVDGGTAACTYDYEFPPNEDGPWARWEREGPVGPENPITVAHTSRSLWVNYSRAETSRFEPQIAISVPNTPAGGYVGTRFAVSLARVGNDANCTPTATANYIVEAGSDIAVPDPAHELPLLVHDPDTADATNTLCTYTATFPQPFDVDVDGSMVRLHKTHGLTAAIADPTPVNGSYEVLEPNFAPDLLVRVPYVDPDGNGSVLAGATFNVAYARVGSDSACTANASEQLTVVAGSLGYGGTAQPPNPRVVSLATVETDGVTPCRYTANFDDSFQHVVATTTHGPYPITSGDDAPFTVDTERLVAVYANDELFFPTFTFGVPQTTDSATGDNTYANGVLSATFAVADGPAAGGCSASATGNGEFNVDFTVSAAGTLGTAPHLPLMLIDVPAGETANCVYTVSVRDEIGSPMGASPTWTLYAQDHPTLTVSPAALTHALAYGTTEPTASSTFQPDVTISIPARDSGFDDGTNDYQGKRIAVRFVRSGGPMQGCSDPADTQTVYVVESTRSNFGARVRPDGGAPDLINVPKYERESCVYEVQFPATVRSSSNITPDLVSTTVDLDAETRASDTAAAVTYHAVETRHPATWDTEGIPFVDGNGDGNNDIAGAELRIDFTLKVTVPPQNSGCSTSGHLVRTITAGGDASAGGVWENLDPASTDDVLVDRPQGEDRQCIYIARIRDLTHPTNSGHRGWSAVNNDIEYWFLNGFLIEFQLAQANFTPDVTIAVPTYNGDGVNSERNAYAGRTIGVSFARSSGPVADCSIGVTETYEIQDNGSVEPQDGSDPELIHLAAGLEGAANECGYSVTYDATASGTNPVLNRVAADLDTTTNDADKATGAKYTAEQTSFMPSVRLRVPFIDGDDADTNSDYNQQPISINYARARGADNRCTPMAQEIYTIGPGGSVSGGGEVLGPTSPATLVDRPAGEETRCEYTADVTDTITPTGGEAVDITDGDDNQTLTGGGPLTVRFSADTFFTPTVTINVPQYDRDGSPGTNWYAGTTFPVTFTAKTGVGPPSGCETVNKNYVVGTGGTVEPEGGAPELVNVPASQTASCVYVAAIDASMAASAPGVTPAWRLRTTGTATQDVSNADAASRTVTREFRADTISFVPTVAVTVPPLVGLTAGENLFDGQTFNVTMQRATTPTQHNDCSLSAPSTARFTVDAAGAATASAVLESLVDRPQGETARCAYTVAFPPTASSASDAELTWTLAPSSTTSTLVAGSTTSAAATGAYATSAAVTYAPDVSFVLPTYNADVDDPATMDVDESTQNALTGAQLRVAFASGAAVCVDATMTFTVQADGSTTADDPLATLVAYPAGINTPCSYFVEFDPNEVGGTRLNRQSGFSSTVTGTAQDISATYHARQSTFMPSLIWRVPFVDGADADTDNDFNAQTITVDYARTASAHSRCTQVAQETYAVGPGASPSSGGVVTGPTTPATLIDRPSGVNERCTYTADVTNAITASTGEVATIGVGSDNQEVTGGGESVTVRFPGGTTFTPTVTIRVPQYDRDAAAGTNYYEGVTFEVSFTAKAGEGPPSGCETVTKRYVVGTTGTVAPQGGVPELVDVPLGQTASCVYVAQLDASVSSVPGATPAWVLRNTGTTTQDVSNANTAGGSATVERRFTADAIYFTPTIAITVPPVEGLTSGVNLFAGTQFRVGFSAAVGAHVECSSQPTMNVSLDYVVGNDAMVTTTETLEPFVDYPAGEETRCEYQVATVPQSPVPSEAGAVLRWQLQRGADATTMLNGGSPAVTASYTVGAVTFSPTVAITVPPYKGDDDPATPANEAAVSAFAGRTFEVSFAQASGSASSASGPASGCATVTKMYAVDDQGGVAPQDGVAPVLTHFPDGDTSAACAYAVTYPPSFGAAPALERQDVGLDDTTSAADLATGAGYLAARTTFVPAVTVALPFVDGDDDQMNDLAGWTLVVSYEPVASPTQDANCSTGETETYAVDAAGSASAGGTVTDPDSAAMLVDRPAGVNERCSYTASTSATAPQAGGDGATITTCDDQTVSATARAVTVSCEASTPEPQQPTTPPVVTPPTGGGTSGGGTARRPTTGGGGGGGGRSGGSGGGSTRTPSTDRDDPADEPSANPPLAGGPFAGFVASSSRRVPVSVSLAQPDQPFTSSATLELLINAPGACGGDITSFSGLAAQVGVVYALAATPNAVSTLVADDSLNWAQFAERGTQQRPCTLRVTLLSAPASCTLRVDAANGADAPVRTDDAGRSYAELTFSDGATALNLTPTLSCAPDPST